MNKQSVFHCAPEYLLDLLRSWQSEIIWKLVYVSHCLTIVMFATLSWFLFGSLTPVGSQPLTLDKVNRMQSQRQP
ncbi:MAG: hypothetical protein L0Y75_09265, partial [Acidobacteria bacterium]|nr:hypothetical protein [Acidobacteriota bacterium]